MRGKVPFIGFERGDDLLEKVRALTGNEARVEEKGVIEWLYGALNVLDSKASALLGVNALLLMYDDPAIQDVAPRVVAG